MGFIVVSFLTLVSFCLGLALCFAGYRFLKVVLGLAGFIVGVAASFSLLFVWFQVPEPVAWAFSLVGGLLGALVAGLAYFVGIFLLGAAFGATAGSIASISISVDSMTLVLMGGLLGGILGLAWQRQIVVFATAGLGSALMVSGGVSYLGGLVSLSPQKFLGSLWGDAGSSGWILLIWLFLFFLGCVVQMRHRERDQSHSPDEESGRSEKK